MSKSLDRLTLLETFVRISDAGSISAAARDLGLSQPSVSRQLAELESRFQAKLMQRTTHSLSLTEAGRALLLDARQLLEAWTVLEEKHMDAGETLSGRLNVVAPVALGQRHLIDIALGFQQQHPLISLVWQLQDSDIRFAEVGCDCWIKIGPVLDQSLTVESLGCAERIVVGTPELMATHDRPHTPQSLEKVPFVALSPFEGGRIPLTNSAGKTVLILPTVKLATNNIFALHRATLASAGLSVLPRWFIADDLNCGRLVEVLPAWKAPKLTIYAATLSGRHQPRRLRSFLQTLRAAMPRLSGIDVATVNMTNADTDMTHTM